MPYHSAGHSRRARRGKGARAGGLHAVGQRQVGEAARPVGKSLRCLALTGPFARPVPLHHPVRAGSSSRRRRSGCVTWWPWPPSSSRSRSGRRCCRCRSGWRSSSGLCWASGATWSGARALTHVRSSSAPGHPGLTPRLARAVHLVCRARFNAFPRYSVERAKAQLGMTFLPLQDTVRDTMLALTALGLRP